MDQWIQRDGGQVQEQALGASAEPHVNTLFVAEDKS